MESHLNYFTDIKHSSQKNVNVTKLGGCAVISPVPLVPPWLISVLAQLHGPFPHNLSLKFFLYQQVGEGG